MLLLAHRCALLFLFILGVGIVLFVRSVDRSVGWSVVGGCLGSVASARSYASFCSWSTGT